MYNFNIKCFISYKEIFFIMYLINEFFKYFFYIIYFYSLLVTSSIVLQDVAIIRFNGYSSSFSITTLFLYIFIVISTTLIINKSKNKLRMTSFILFLVSFSDLVNLDIQDIYLHYFFLFIMLISIILFIYSFLITNYLIDNIKLPNQNL